MYIVVYIKSCTAASITNEIATNVFALLCGIADKQSICIVASLMRLHSNMQHYKAQSLTEKQQTIL
jgi:hypothetical protein